MPFLTLLLWLWPRYQRCLVQRANWDTWSFKAKLHAIILRGKEMLWRRASKSAPLGNGPVQCNRRCRNVEWENALIDNASCTAQWHKWPTLIMPRLSLVSRRINKTIFLVNQPCRMHNYSVLRKLLFLLPSPATCTHNHTRKKKRVWGEWSQPLAQTTPQATITTQ